MSEMRWVLHWRGGVRTRVRVRVRVRAATNIKNTILFVSVWS